MVDGGSRADGVIRRAVTWRRHPAPSPHSSRAARRIERMKPVSLANLTVLVVDDDAAIREMVGTMLRRLAIKPVEAENGAQAVQLFRAAPALFDLVICDWNMPGMSGIDLCQQMRAERPELPFLLVTGRG